MFAGHNKCLRHVQIRVVVAARDVRVDSQCSAGGIDGLHQQLLVTHTHLSTRCHEAQHTARGSHGACTRSGVHGDHIVVGLRASQLHKIALVSVAHLEVSRHHTRRCRSHHLDNFRHVRCIPLSHGRHCHERRSIHVARTIAAGVQFGHIAIGHNRAIKDDTVGVSRWHRDSHRVETSQLFEASFHLKGRCSHADALSAGTAQVQRHLPSEGTRRVRNRNLLHL